MDWIDAQELAAVALGLSDDADTDTVEQALYDKMEITLEQFQKVAEALLPLTVIAQAALSGNVYQGFVKDGAFIVKQAVTQAPAVEASGAN